MQGQEQNTWNRILCECCQCTECCFCRNYVPDSSGSRRTGSSPCDVCGTDNAGVNMGKEYLITAWMPAWVWTRLLLFRPIFSYATLLLIRLQSISIKFFFSL